MYTFEPMTLSASIQKRLNGLCDDVPETVFARAMELAQLRSPCDLRALAQMDHRIENAGDVFDYVRHVTQLTMPFSSYKACGFFKDNVMTLGQVALAGLSYSVFASFDDAVQMQNIEEYCRVPVRARAAELRENLGLGPLTLPTRSEARSSTPASRTAPRP
jgi:hypothetical protein